MSLVLLQQRISADPNRMQTYREVKLALITMDDALERQFSALCILECPPILHQGDPFFLPRKPL